MEKGREKQMLLSIGDKLELHNSELQCQVYKKDIQTINNLLTEEQKNFTGILNRILGGNKEMTGVNFKEGIIKYIEIPAKEVNPKSKK